MEVKKLNDLTYVFRFNTRTQAKDLFHYLYKASEQLCMSNCDEDCDHCELSEGCCEYWKSIIDVLPKITE